MKRLVCFGIKSYNFGLDKKFKYLIFLGKVDGFIVFKLLFVVVKLFGVCWLVVGDLGLLILRKRK